MTISREPTRARLDWIDAAKGIGILLVVFGHAVDGLSSAGIVTAASPLTTAFYLIYAFHMPLFFFLSGLLVERRVTRDRAGFIARLVPSIVWPYLLWSVIQLTVISLASAYVNHPLGSLSARTYLGILWNPPSQFWFLYALLIFHLMAATLVRKTLPAIYMVIAAAMLFPFTDLFGESLPIVDMATHFFLYYALGVYMGQFLPRLREDAARWPVATGAIAIFVLCAGAGLSRGLFYWSPALLPAAVAGTIFTLFAAIHIRGAAASLFRYLGQRAMAIYVLHVLFVAGTRILVVRLTGLDHPGALVLLLTAVGVAGPLIAAAAADRLGLSARLGLGGPPRPERQPAYG